MSDWTDGYVTGVGYTYGYYAELNPLRSRLALLNAGWAAPDLITAGPSCELGMGQGISVNVHAAASGTPWYGTDFNPSQAAFAQELSQRSGAQAQGTQLFDQSFADFCQRPDLPDFGFIGVHGIWSWISDANRAVIVDFVRRKLRVGGVLYISYNTQPGWAAMSPMRDLLAEHAQVMGVPGRGMASCIDGSLAFANRLMESNPLYAQANPQIAARLKRLQGMSRNYLAHEYFNRDWQPMAFSRMAQWLMPAKLTYACSAHYIDHVATLNFTADQQAVLQEQPDAQFRESVRDFLINQQFRRDYWVRGPRKLASQAQAQALGAQRVMLVTATAEVSMKVKAPVGDATLSASIYEPVLAALGDHQVHTMDDVWRQLQDSNHPAPVSLAQLNEALVLLVGKGDVVAVQDAAAAGQTQAPTRALNQHLLGLARHSADVGFLCSPVSAGGVTVNRFQQLFILAMQESATGSASAPADPVALARYAWQVIAGQGQRLLRDGKPMEAADDNMAELTLQATAFIASRLPVLRRLQVLD